MHEDCSYPFVEHAHEIIRERIGDKNRDAFALFARENYPQGEFSEKIIDEMLASGDMWKTGQWKGFLDHLKNGARANHL